MRLAGPNTTVRSLRHWETYLTTEAELQERGQILDIDSFIDLRREYSAVRLYFDLIESCSGIDLPEEVFEDPILLEIYWAAVDFVCWSNVRCSAYFYHSGAHTHHNRNRMYTPMIWSKLKGSVAATLSPPSCTTRKWTFRLR